MRLLIVEDSAVERIVLRSAIEYLGHCCSEATTAAEAWTALTNERFDVVLTDWLMPGGTGPELCQRIRASSDQPHVYVALCTSLAEREHGLNGVRAGADTFLTKPIDPVELEMCLIAAERVTAMHRELEQRNAELTRLNTVLEERAHTDSLTGLGNRFQLQDDLHRLRALADRYDVPLSIAMCDLDRFKAYNDRFGHLAGDDTLRRVARILVEQCRASDAVYRFGGEELLVLLPHQTAESAVVAVERVRKAVEDAQLPHPDNLPFGVVTVSIGVASLDDAVDTEMASLLDLADQALYEAKRSGRNRLSVHGSLGSPASGCAGSRAAHGPEGQMVGSRHLTH
jgi:two-component system chemotaxis response regulator CheY